MMNDLRHDDDDLTVLGFERSRERGAERYELDGMPCDLADVLPYVDSEHALPLRALAIGDEHEIPQVGSPSLFVTRVR